ncbi:hypothetical protein BGZ72_005013 [Mortierella alpina]|nr:hypothetical protein BGZ72_005013 [Mortierella alpina]
MARRGGGGGSGWTEETTYIVCGVIGGIFLIYLIYLCYKHSNKKGSPSAQPTGVPGTGTAGPATIVSVHNPNHNSAQAQPLLTNYYAGPTSQGPMPPQPAPNGAYPGYAPVGTPASSYAQPSPYGNAPPPAAPYPGMPSPHAGGYAPMPAPGSSQPYQF